MTEDGVLNVNTEFPAFLCYAHMSPQTHSSPFKEESVLHIVQHSGSFCYIFCHSVSSMGKFCSAFCLSTRLANLACSRSRILGSLIIMQMHSQLSIQSLSVHFCHY